MKKGLIIALIIILGAVGYLAYDWHVKTKILEDDQRVTLYSWTDEKGTKHYTNTQPRTVPETSRKTRVMNIAIDRW